VIEASRLKKCFALKSKTQKMGNVQMGDFSASHSAFHSALFSAIQKKNSKKLGIE
jgi:hypothetical protein